MKAIVEPEKLSKVRRLADPNGVAPDFPTLNARHLTCARAWYGARMKEIRFSTKILITWGIKSAGDEAAKDDE
jgi:hypothetical protein